MIKTRVAFYYLEIETKCHPISILILVSKVKKEGIKFKFNLKKYLILWKKVVLWSTYETLVNLVFFFFFCEFEKARYFFKFMASTSKSHFFFILFIFQSDEVDQRSFQRAIRMFFRNTNFYCRKNLRSANCVRMQRHTVRCNDRRLCVHEKPIMHHQWCASQRTC